MTTMKFSLYLADAIIIVYGTQISYVCFKLFLLVIFARTGTILDMMEMTLTLDSYFSFINLGNKFKCRMTV